jgi:hypothetical protein
VQRPNDLGRRRRLVPLEGRARERDEELVVLRQIFLGRLGWRLLRRRRYGDENRHVRGSHKSSTVAKSDARKLLPGPS